MNTTTYLTNVSHFLSIADEYCIPNLICHVFANVFPYIMTNDCSPFYQFCELMDTAPPKVPMLL